MGTRTEAERTKRRLSALQRRVDWLKKRVHNYKGNDPSHDIAEMHAIQWAIDVITKGHEVTVRTND